MGHVSGGQISASVFATQDSKPNVSATHVVQFGQPVEGHVEQPLTGRQYGPVKLSTHSKQSLQGRAIDKH